MHPESLIEAVNYFSDPAVTNAYMRKIKWPDGKNVSEIATRPILQCRACRKQCSFKTGTSTSACGRFAGAGPSAR